jgi:ferric-dicitrate binding protein FerR (iron transport regulator)
MMKPDGERIASLEEWRENHSKESRTRYEEIRTLLGELKADMSIHREEMLATARRNHKRMDAHAKMAVGGLGAIGVSIIGWLATALWGAKS